MNIRRRILIIFSSALFLACQSGCGLFLQRYELSIVVEDEAGGQVTADPLQDSYSENTVVELTAEPDPGWTVGAWSGVSENDGTRASVLMDMNRRVTVKFEPELDRYNPSDNLIIPPDTGFAPTVDDSWTFMIYLDGDNDLEPYAQLDFDEIRAGLAAAANPHITAVILYDRRGSGDTRRYRMKYDEASSVVAVIEEAAGELNMGDPGVLTDFIVWSRASSVTGHYALFLWNHGGGARSTGFGDVELAAAPQAAYPKLICQDENTGTGTGSDYLFTDELQQAVSAALASADFPGGIELTGIDACLMGTVEAAYEMRNLTDYYVASMADENVHGWSYDDLFGRMKGDSAADAGSLAMLIVDSFRETAPLSPVPTLSAVRTAGLEQLKADIDRLAAALHESGNKAVIESIRDKACDFFDDDYEAEAVSAPYHDLNDLCTLILNNSGYVSAASGVAAEAVIERLSSVVVSAYAGSGAGNYYGRGADVGRGLSIFFSMGNLQYKNASQYASQYWYTDRDCSSIGPYGRIDFCTSDDDGAVESWREMHEAWYDPYPAGGFTPGSW